MRRSVKAIKSNDIFKESYYFNTPSCSFALLNYGSTSASALPLQLAAKEYFLLPFDLAVEGLSSTLIILQSFWLDFEGKVFKEI